MATLRAPVAALAGRYRSLTLRTKFALHLVVSITVLFGLFVPAIAYLQARAALEQAKHRGSQLAKVFAYSSVQAIVADDFLVLRHMVNSVSSEPDVLYAMIVDPSGRLLVHTDMNEMGRRYADPVSLAAAAAEQPTVHELDTPKAYAYDFAVPIYVLNERAAVARIGISFARELAVIRRARNLSLGLGVVALVAGIVLARLQARSVTRPVQDLVRGADEITKGNLQHRISVPAGDEMGQLARAFNHMTESVQAMIETSREISSALDLDVVLKSITEHALTLVRADVAFMAPVEPKGRNAPVRVVLGARTTRLYRLVVAPGVGLGGAVLATGEPIASDNYVGDPRFVHDPAYDKGAEEEGIVSALALPILLKGEIIGLLWVANRTARAFSGEDVDALRRMTHQAAIAMDNARLYEDLRQSHQALVNAQTELVWKTRMAAMGEIAAAVAHEARNPLGALGNCIQLLRGNPNITGEDAELLTIMQNESKRLNDIVSDFLAFGRPRAPRFAPVDLHELIDETWALLQRDDRCPAAIVFERRFDAALTSISADRDQLRQVFWNLFLNAVQAMRNEGTLMVETRQADGSIDVFVRDTGPGISPAVLPRLFEPFVTAGSGGTGLGLAIVRRIIEDHGGHITVGAREWTGTCFVLSLFVDTRKV